MTKTHAEFLEELKNHAKRHAIENQYSSGYYQGIGDAYRCILEKIARFEAEQKQVKDEQKHT